MVRSLPAARLALLAAVGLAAVAAAPSGAATSPAAFGTGAAQFVVSAAPSELPSVGYAGEPSLGVNWKSGNALFMSSSSTYKLHFDNRAQPPTVTWSDVSSPYSLVNVDPILATDPATGVTLAGGDDGACALLSRTSDDGESWSPALPCTGVVDHPSVGVGPFLGGAAAGGSGPVAAYYCQQYPILNQCSRSLDGGTTWSPATTVRGCAGLFGHIKVAPNGTVYVPSAECFSGGLPFVGDALVGGFVSRDNGLTWGSWTIPGAAWPDRGFDPSVGIGSDGAIFESWSADQTAHPMVSWSRDDTAHWSKPVDLATTVDPPLTGSTFMTTVAGSAGRAAVAFLGTRHQPAKDVSVMDDPGAIWHLYVSMTYDGGTTWTTTQVTQDPVQRGGISDGGVAGDETRNLLDFMDAGVTREGRVVVGFADGCIDKGGCTLDGGTPATSRDSYATVAYQSYGRGLFAQYDS
jgi:hypothetical protein